MTRCEGKDGENAMNWSPRRTAVALIATAMLGVGHDAAGAAVAQYTQTFQLRPGWNAVFLEVRPEPNDSDSVFGALPLASAWTWNPRVGKIEFVENQNEEMIASPTWLGYFPRPRPEAVLTNLFSVQANRAYLIKIEGDQPVTWSVTGRPEVSTTRWLPDSFNLVGFPVDPFQQPTFAQFLAPSPAHAGQPIYQLGADGVWTLVDPYSARIHSGEAYWVYSQGPSDYTAPIALEIDSGRTLDFGGGALQERVRIRNEGTTPVGINLSKLPSPAPIPLSVFLFDADSGAFSWPALPASYTLPCPEQGELMVDLAPRRAEFTADEVGTVLAVRDGFGTRRLIAIDGKAATAPPSFVRRRAAEGRTFEAVTVDNPRAGLWIGTVIVKKVSQAQTGSLTPTPVGREFTFRILLHVDATGTVRLLKDVIQLWHEGTRIPDPENPGLFLVDEPGYYVLVTDDSLLSSFEGAALRDGQPVGYRISSVTYDFDPQTVVMNGSFSVGASVATTLAMESEGATNPFRHGFHPDHNNLNERYTAFLEEAYAVTRQIELEFADADPLERDLPNYGESAIGGTYREQISGLHRNDIAVEGIFTLQRVSARAVLNQ